MEPIDIKYALERSLGRGAQTIIAKRCGRTPQMVYRVITLSETSAHIRREIAKAIGKDVSEIWPQYYAKRAVNQ
jgi:lambda repressor-like predicted transcriptional regulator